MIILANIHRNGFLGSMHIKTFKCPSAFPERLIPIKIPIKSVLACLFHTTLSNIEHCHYIERFLKGTIGNNIINISIPPSSQFSKLYILLFYSYIEMDYFGWAYATETGNNLTGPGTRAGNQWRKISVQWQASREELRLYREKLVEFRLAKRR